MDNEPATAPQAEAAPVVPPEPVAAAPVQTVTLEDISNAYLQGSSPKEIERLEAAFSGQQTAQVEEPVVAEPESEPETPVAEPPEPEEPAGEQPRGDAKDQGRFRFKDEADKAVAMLAKAKGISLVEAAAIFAGAPAKPDHTAEVTTPDVPPEVAQIESEIATQDAVLAQLKKDRREYLTDPQVFATELADIEDKRDDALSAKAFAQAKLEAAKSNAKQEAQSRQQREQTETQQAIALSEKYPGFADPDEPMFAVANQISRRLRADNDPKWNDLPHLAELAAAKLGIKPAGKTAVAAPVATVVKAPPKPGPALGTRTSEPPKPALTAAQIEQEEIAKSQAAVTGQVHRSGAGSNMIGNILVR